MPLPDGMLKSAVRITALGGLEGTGFLLRVAGESGPHLYVATAHHVIKNKLEIAVEAPEPFTNGGMYESTPVSDWRQPIPGVDLAVAPFPEDQPREATWLEMVLPLPGRPQPDLGQHIFYIGIFEPLDRPMARSGTIGALFQEGIPHSNGNYRFDAHLVDCRSYKGFSGSPCVAEFAFPVLDASWGPAWIPGAGINQEEGRPMGGMQYYAVLCGMFTSHFSDEDRPDADGAASRYGVGVMLPSSEIRRALMTEDMQAERRATDQKRAATKAAEQPPLQDASVRGENPEFERFEALTQNLVNTPKSEK
jgi:Trypsin-like peptidase domain